MHYRLYVVHIWSVWKSERVNLISYIYKVKWDQLIEIVQKRDYDGYIYITWIYFLSNSSDIYTFYMWLEYTNTNVTCLTEINIQC